MLKVLAGRFERRVVSLVGDAGLGKTVLLSQAVLENRLAPRGLDVWLSCEERDQDAGELAAGLLTGLGIDAGGETGPPERAACRIAAEVRARAPVEVAFVLDDTHRVGAGTAGADFLSRLVAELPANGHLVLCGRRPPPVPLARIEARGQATRLGPSDLAFTDEESAAFAELRGASAALVSGTGGWPAIAELTVSVGHASAVRFLWEEVLAGIPARVRRLLAGLVAIGGADTALARGALGSADADPLAELGAVPLLSRTADGWWVAHALWEPAVAGVLSPREVAGLRRRAGLALADRGRFDAAMRQLLAAEAWADVRGLIRRYLCTQPGTLRDVDLLGAWYAALPATLRGSPEGLLTQAASLRLRDPAASTLLHARAAAGFRAAGDAGAEASALLSQLLSCFWHGDPAQVLDVVTRLSELAEAGSALAAVTIAAFHALLAPDLPTGLAALERIGAAGHAILDAFVDWQRALHLLALGQPARAEPYARRAARELPAEASAALIEVLRCTGRTGSADVEASLLLAGRFGAPTTRQYAVAIALLAFTGHPDEARAHLPAARAAAAATSVMHWTAAALALAESAVAVADADETAAAGLLRDGLAAVPLGHSTLRRVHEGLVALSYVLLPETRAGWDAEAMDGTTGQVRAMACALVTLRETGGTGAHADLPPVEADAVRGLLSWPWLVELGVGLHSLGRPDGVRLIDGLGGPIRSSVRALAASPVKRLAGSARRLLSVIPSAPRHQLTINALGPLEILHDGVPVSVDALRRERVRQFLSFMVAEPVTTREAIAAALWPDFDETTARNNLKVTLSYVQKILEPDRDDGEAPYYLRVSGQRLRLWPEGPEVDAWRFEKLLDDAAEQEEQGLQSRALERYQQALALYRGDFLMEAPPVDWLDAEQQRLRARFVSAAVRAGELLLGDSAHDGALRLAVRALRADPWSERAHRLVVASYLAAGDRGSAERALRNCHATLEDLGVEPEPATLMLARRIGHPA